MAEAGANCVVTELPQKLSSLDPVCSAVADVGRRAVALPLMLPDMDSIDALVRNAVAEFGRIDVLVNNAGVNIPRAGPGDHRSRLGSGARREPQGAVLPVAAGRAGDDRDRGGKIVNIASQNGVVGYFKRAAYCSSKAGVVNLTRVLALEWAEHKILVNAVAPTFVLTPLTQSTFDDPLLREDLLKRIPLGRVGQPEDVVGAVVFLASPAADMITGHTLLVDGGWTAI